MSDSEPVFKVPLPLSKAGCSKDSVSSTAPKKPDYAPPLVYTEPEWGGIPPSESYSFEVIKQGTIISNIPVSKSFLVIGRLANCDIPVEHPSCSRYHAILQYCRGGTVYPEGLYVYDLDSTHGTYVNKEQIRSKVYYRLRTGHVIKFGASTRLYVMQGPEKEEEEMHVQKSDHCDWGFKEDAEEDDNMTETPCLGGGTTTENEEMYLNDPKKVLRDWFEREGYDLQYEIEEKAFKNFFCQVKLPIDNPSEEAYVPVEVTVCGKKKEAVKACALEACRMLDRCGLLHQAHKESRKRKRKNWEEDDFYDSDEDTYLDRTGTIEKKREFRKKLLNYEEHETYETLVQKINQICEEIIEIERKLVKSKSAVPVADDEKIDPLDSYMSTITNLENVHLDAITKSRLRQRLNDLKNEKNKLEKMRDIAKPPNMLKIKTSTSEAIVSEEIVAKDSEPVQTKTEDNLKNQSNIETVKCVSNTISAGHNPECSQSVEMSSEDIPYEEQSNNSAVKSEVSQDIKKDCTDITVWMLPDRNNPGCSQNVEMSSEDVYNERLDNPANKPENSKTVKKEILENCGDGCYSMGSPSDRHNPGCSQNVEMSSDDVQHGEQLSNPVSKSEGSKVVKKDWMDSCNDDDYSMWLPPDDQSGDGTTHLNAKYGY